MQSDLLSYDPETGITEIFHWDPATGMAMIETQQPIDDLLAANNSWYAAVSKHTPWKDGLGERVASIPMLMFASLQKSGIADDKKALAKLLNDSDYRKLRTRPGMI